MTTHINLWRVAYKCEVFNKKKKETLGYISLSTFYGGYCYEIMALCTYQRCALPLRARDETETLNESMSRHSPPNV